MSPRARLAARGGGMDMPALDLARESCKPCSGITEPLSTQEVADLMPGISAEWRVVHDGHALERDLRFDDFMDAMRFLNAVAAEAEAEDHHPDFELTLWNRVKITQKTDVINALSRNDFVIAAKIDEILAARAAKRAAVVAVLDAKKSVAQRFHAEVLVAGRIVALDDLLGPAFVEHAQGGGATGGRADLERSLAARRSAFPDARYEAHHVVGEDDRIALRGSWSGTHRGPFLGVAATGRTVTVGEHHLFRIVDARIVEHWSELDGEGLMRQLGRESMAPLLSGAGR